MILYLQGTLVNGILEGISRRVLLGKGPLADVARACDDELTIVVGHLNAGIVLGLLTRFLLNRGGLGTVFIRRFVGLGAGRDRQSHEAGQKERYELLGL